MLTRLCTCPVNHLPSRVSSDQKACLQTVHVRAFVSMLLKLVEQRPAAREDRLDSEKRSSRGRGFVRSTTSSDLLTHP